jgi:hypothetical protein
MRCVLYNATKTVDVAASANAFAATYVVTTSNFVATISNDVATTPTAYATIVAHVVSGAPAIDAASIANM